LWLKHGDNKKKHQKASQSKSKNWVDFICDDHEKNLTMRKTLPKFLIISFKIFSLPITLKEFMKLCKWSKIDCEIPCVTYWKLSSQKMRLF